MAVQSLADQMREAQGMLPPVEVAGKQYTFTKLRRRECQETLYNLVQPLIDSVSVVIESAGLSIADLSDMDKISEAILANVGLVAKIFKTISYNQIHELAKSLLRNVVIDGKIQPDDFEKPDSNEPGYYDDKQIELIRAIFKAVQVNYPFLGSLIKNKENTKEDSDQSSDQTGK